jgi:quercetin dioxygenase-like cupin family protein
MKSLKPLMILAAVTFMASCFFVLYAQPGAPTRNVLTKQDLPDLPGREGVVANVEFAPGAKETKHTHPGDVFVYVQEGSLTVYIDGQPTKTVKAGEVFFVPAGKVHWGENTGTTTAKTVATFVVEKGKPLASPAP